MADPRSRPRRGFTLTEILVSSLLVVCGVTVWGMTFLPASLTLSRSRHFDLATTACYAELEAWRARGYSQIPSGTGTVTLTGTSLLHSLPTDLPNGSGSLVIRRESVSGSGTSFSFSQTASDTGRAQLEITVSWTGVGVDQGSVTMTSLVVQ